MIADLWIRPRQRPQAKAHSAGRIGPPPSPAACGLQISALPKSGRRPNSSRVRAARDPKDRDFRKVLTENHRLAVRHHGGSSGESSNHDGTTPANPVRRITGRGHSLVSCNRKLNSSELIDGDAWASGTWEQGMGLKTFVGAAVVLGLVAGPGLAQSGHDHHGAPSGGSPVVTTPAGEKPAVKADKKAPKKDAHRQQDGTKSPGIHAGH